MFKTLKGRFTFVYSSYVMIFIILIIGVVYIRERLRLFEKAEIEYRKLSQLNAEVIGGKISENFLLLENIADRIQATQISEEDILSELKLLAKGINTNYYNTGFINEDGVIMKNTGEKTYVEDMKEFEKIKNRDSKRITLNSFVGKNNKNPLIVLGEVIRDSNNNFIGVLSISILLEKIINQIDELQLDDSSFPWIIDSKGVVIYHPDEIYINQINSQEISKSGYSNFLKVSQRVISARDGFIRYYNGEEKKKKVLAFYEIPNTPSWKLSISIEQNAIFREIHKIMLGVIFAGILMVLFLIILIFNMIDSITFPIMRLTKAVENSIDRNFEPLALDLSDDNEISHLILAYNEMATAITLYTEELEEIVAERTKELDQLNKKLAEKNKKLSVENETLFDKSVKDVLTGLYNRAQLNRHLRSISEKLQNETFENCSLLFLDLDNFKYYNDTFGHDIGDKLLIFIAENLTNCLRGDDFIARYGGDEFTIVLPNVNNGNSINIKANLVKEIDKYEGFGKQISKWLERDNIEIPDDKKLGISVGIFCFNKESLLPVDELIIQADKKMYDEKKKRKKKRQSKS